MKYYIGTLSELREIEQIIRNNTGIPNSKGTRRFAMSLEGEKPEVLPIATATEGLYAYLVDPEGWNGFTYAETYANITADEVDQSEITFPEVEY